MTGHTTKTRKDSAASTTRWRAQAGAVHLPAQHRDLLAQDQEFDVLGAVVADELGQHADVGASGPGDQSSPRMGRSDDAWLSAELWAD
jgi:hypothetical protein